jgi:hypothetical protein
MKTLAEMNFNVQPSSSSKVPRVAQKQAVLTSRETVVLLGLIFSSKLHPRKKDLYFGAPVSKLADLLGFKRNAGGKSHKHSVYLWIEDAIQALYNKSIPFDEDGHGGVSRLLQSYGYVYQSKAGLEVENQRLFEIQENGDKVRVPVTGLSWEFSSQIESAIKDKGRAWVIQKDALPLLMKYAGKKPLAYRLAMEILFWRTEGYVIQKASTIMQRAGFENMPPRKRKESLEKAFKTLLADGLMDEPVKVELSADKSEAIFKFRLAEKYRIGSKQKTLK